MFLSNKIILTLIFILILSFFHFSVIAKDKKENRAIFKGKVFNISERFITIERTSIVLPQKIKIIDSQGTYISFERIRKGDYVIVTIEKNEAIIQRIGENQKDVNHELIPQ